MITYIGAGRYPTNSPLPAHGSITRVGAGVVEHACLEDVLLLKVPVESSGQWCRRAHCAVCMREHSQE